MIPEEIAEIADLICPGWDSLSDEESADVVTAAYRIWRAGYRKVEGPTP